VPWHCPLPLVVTLHDFIPLHVPALFNDKAINRWWHRRQMHIAARARRLICVSEATRQDALRFLGAQPQRCAVIYEGVDRTVFHPAADPPPAGPPTILFVGGDYPNKNRPAALAAFARLTQDSALPHHLVLVGRDDTPDDELARRTPGIDLRRVRRLQQVSQDELARLYRTADLFLPEVAGEAALLVDPHDSAALAAAMVQVLADRALHGRLRAAGLARAAEFTWQAAARQTLAVYREAAGA
jgi:alpha-1,3-rhamnosyl/mannosyltransferase